MGNSNEHMRAYMKQRRLTRRNRLLEMAGGCCVKCGSLEGLQFDHKNPGTKAFILSGCYLDKAWTQILAEFEKCDLLCTKCHKHKTRENGEGPGGHNKILDVRHGTAHMYVQGKCRGKDCRYARSLHRKHLIGYNEMIIAPNDWIPRMGKPRRILQ
jgi:hypothetical protein